VSTHVSVIGFPARANGAIVSIATVTVDVFVHPLLGLVTITVYVPGLLIVGLFVVPPETIPGPDQLNVAPVVEDVTEIELLVVVHVNVAVAVVLMFGGVISLITKTELTAVQPVSGSVTVTT
jgi:hypothetical protein